MLLCYHGWTLEQISAAISIATPVILLFWFYYSQKQILSKVYYDQIDGIYAGFTDPVYSDKGVKGLYSGIIMNIRNTDEKGYFKGELDYGETVTDIVNDHLVATKPHDGIYTFMGKLNFRMYKNKTRHPFKPEQNRIYKGKLFIVDRLDFEFTSYKLETYLSAEYEIIHYREMQTLKFNLKKTYNKENPKLPTTFTLHKKMGFDFEPYKNVKEVVFLGQQRVDK